MLVVGAIPVLHSMAGSTVVDTAASDITAREAATAGVPRMSDGAGTHSPTGSSLLAAAVGAVGAGTTVAVVAALVLPQEAVAHRLLDALANVPKAAAAAARPLGALQAPPNLFVLPKTERRAPVVRAVGAMPSPAVVAVVAATSAGAAEPAAHTRELLQHPARGAAPAVAAARATDPSARRSRTQSALATGTSPSPMPTGAAHRPYSSPRPSSGPGPGGARGAA